MTEKEKAAAGFLYNANGEELTRERNYCKDLCFEYNRTLPSDTEKQRLLIKKIFGRTKESYLVTAPFQCDYGYNIEIGENFYANHGCVFLDCAKITFGDNCFIAPNCCFSAAGHPLDAKERNIGLEYAYPISVGNNVWIGAGVIVLPGVTIGANSVIGAGSVVNRDIPNGVIAVGNPCRVLREITKEDAGKYRKFEG